MHEQKRRRGDAGRQRDQRQKNRNPEVGPEQACKVFIAKNVWDFIGGGWSVLLAVLGSLYIFRKNGGAAGEQFLQRYVAIGWVVTLRWLVVVLALTIVLSVTGVFGEHTTWREAVFFAVVEVFVWWRIGYHTGDVARKTARREP